MKTKIILAIIVIIGLIILISPQSIYAIDAPHNESNNVYCGSCHGQTVLLNSPFWSESSDYDKICTDICHFAPFGPYTDNYSPRVKTHSSANTNNNYGDWARQCIDCHEPHYQLQKNYKNTDASRLYLATGTITACLYNGDGTSTLTHSNISYKSGWDATKLTQKTSTFRRAILFPNVNKLGYDYPIIAVDTPTANEITISGNACTYLYPPTTFAAIYGQYIKDVINNLPVKFFDQTGANSFADGNTTHDGTCDVCHTQTQYHKNDGTGDSHYATTNCISCHSHTSGFAYGGLDVVVDALQTSQMPELFAPRFFPWDLPDQSTYQMTKATNDGLLKYIYGSCLAVNWNVYDLDKTSLTDTIIAMKLFYSSRGLDTWMKNNNVNFTIDISSVPKWLSSDPTNNNPIDSFQTCTASSGSFCIWAQSPPNCYDLTCGGNPGWASLVKEVVKYFNGNPANGNLGLHAPLNVWHEPSWNYFYGTEADYYQLYKYALVGIAAAEAEDPYIQNIQIAGPAPVTLSCKHIVDPNGSSNCADIDGNLITDINGNPITNGPPMMQDFIEYAGSHRLDYDNDTANVHLHYNKWPIDIISFSGLDQYGNTWKNIADQTKGWLTSEGYSANTPMFSQELGNWFFNGTNYLDPNRDSEYIASYLINQLGWLDKANIDRYFFTTLFDWHSYSSYPLIATQEFIGLNDPWTSTYVIKPVYNAFKALNILNGASESETTNRISATFADNDFITAVASQTQDKSRTRLLLSNFVPVVNTGGASQFMAGVYRSCLLSKNYTLNDANSILSNISAYNQSHHPSQCSSGTWTSSCLSTLISGTFDSTQTANDLLECTNNSVTGVLKKYDDLNTYSTNPRQVNVVISGLPFSGTATLTTYIIDKDHSNSCKINKATEITPTSSECGVNGIIDVYVLQAKTDSVNDAGDYLLALGYTQSQVDAFVNCALTPGCSVQTLINNYCTQYPSLCDKLKADIAEATKLRNGLLYYGSYTATTGHHYTIPIYIDKINNDPTLFASCPNCGGTTVPLEGSKQESQINVTRGVYSGTIIMQPYSVVLLEITAN